MKIEINDKCLKSRQGRYVIYDVDWLLDHLAGEVALLWNSKQRRITVPDKADYDKLWRDDKKENTDDL